MSQNEYKPKPVDVSDVDLPDSLKELMEQIAENVHEVWSRGRMEDGWMYGPERDDKLKTHPCLIPYGKLDEKEKEYDRNTALNTLKLIIKLGYNINKG
ncbi:RyR domain-containing protein [Bacteroides caecigallinarum]|nr:RyR domain-containing protein [Bacteroides caecigallinarum]